MKTESKNIFKKIAAALFVICMCVSVVCAATSCDNASGKSSEQYVKEVNGLTVAEAYERAFEEIKNYSNCKVKGIITETIDIYELAEYVLSSGGYSDITAQDMVDQLKQIYGIDKIEVEFDMTQMFVGKNFYENMEVIQDDNQFSSILSAADFGEEMWYIDETLYISKSHMGIWSLSNFKASISYEDLLENSLVSSDGEAFTSLQIPKEWIKDISFKKEENGYSADITVDGQKEVERMAEIMKGNSMLAGIYQNSSIEKLVYTVYFDENLSVYRYTMEMLINIMGIDATATFDYSVDPTCSLSDFSALPSDVGSYIDYTDQFRR